MSSLCHDAHESKHEATSAFFSGVYSGYGSATPTLSELNWDFFEGMDISSLLSYNVE
jgi:hypothetical protein